MKGPYQRLKFAVRRLWECPVCRHRTHTPGDVTSLVCRCQDQADAASRRFMHLIEDSPPTKPSPTPVEIAVATPVEVAAAEVTAPITDSLPSPD